MNAYFIIMKSSDCIDHRMRWQSKARDEWGAKHQITSHHINAIQSFTCFDIVLIEHRTYRLLMNDVSAWVHLGCPMENWSYLYGWVGRYCALSKIHTWCNYSCLTGMWLQWQEYCSPTFWIGLRNNLPMNLLLICLVLIPSTPNIFRYKVQHE